MHGFRNHSIYLVTRHFVSICQFVNIKNIRSSGNRSTHRIIIIFANKNDRKFPEHGKIKSFMEDSLPRGSVSEKTKDYIICIFILFSKSKPGACSNLCAYNSVASEKSVIYTKKMHTATFSFTTACGFGI